MHAWGVNIWTYTLTTILIFIPIIVLVIIAMAQLFVRNSMNTRSASNPGLNITSVILVVISVLAIIALGVIITGASIKIQLDSARGTKLGFREALAAGRKYGLRLVGLGILVGLIVLVGFILLIVPGVFMMKRYLLSPYYLVDKDMGITEAMRACAADSKTYSSAIWGLLGVLLLFSVIGDIPLIGLVGSILALLYAFAPAVRYVEIENLQSGASAQTIVTQTIPQAAV